MEEREGEGRCIEDAHARVLALPWLARWWHVSLESGNVLCNYLRQRLLIVHSEMRESLPDFVTRIQIHGQSARFCKRGNCLVELRDPPCPKRGGGILQNQHVR